MDKPITLTLPTSWVQYILNQLAERPFKEVGDIIPAIMKQATEGSTPPAEAPPTP